MTLATDFDRLFVEGFAQLLATQINTLHYPATTDPFGVFIPNLDPDTVGPAVWLAPYWLGDDAALADSTRGLQIGIRSNDLDPRPVMLLDDTIANALLGLYSFTLPTGVAVSSLQRTSSTPLMQEDGGKKRWWKTSNYTALCYRPSANRH